MCFVCEKNEASAKIGESKGNILLALFGKRCWSKKEIYVCKQCYKESFPEDVETYK